MLEWIMSIVQLSQTAIATGKTLLEWRDSQLTEHEQELLRTAAEDGLFVAMQMPSVGRYVECTQRAFVSNDRAFQAHYLDAFMRLVDRGLVMHQAGHIFCLTGQGFDLARKLRG